MKHLLLLMVLLSSLTASAQVTSPPSDRRDSVRTPIFQPSPRQQLPPGMLLELQRLQGKRTLLFHDTVRGSDIQRAHLNDSVEQEYVDSAFTLADTVVSLSHKEWLDSELVEIPELERFGTRVHFTYPPAIMVETQVEPVPFDTAILAHMNPITRENLPFFDQSPMPLPLRPSAPIEGYVEAGAGNLYLPRVGGWLSTTLSPRSYLDARASFLSRGSSAVRNLLSLGGGFHAQLGEDPAQALFASTNLGLHLGYDSKGTALYASSDTSDRTQSLFGARLTLQGDATDKLHFTLDAADNEFKDAYRKGLSESGQDVDAQVHYDPYISHFRIIAEGGLHVASLRLDTLGSIRAVGSSNAIRSNYVKAFFGRRKGEAIEWYGGLAFLTGTDARGVAHTVLSPAARVRIPLNPRWELGGYFEPEAQLMSLRAVATQNPFYSPYLAAPYQGDSLVRRLDVRSVMLDRARVGGFMNYALSPDDQIRTEVRFISRTGEPVFTEHRMDSGSAIFALEPHDTRRLQFIFGADLLVFDRDVITASVQYSSATATETDEGLPFEPTLKASAQYHFNSINGWLRPVLEFESLSRTDRTITLVNAEARMEVSPKISIFVRAENLAGSASDFWTGYEEAPRSIWATVRLGF